MYVLNFTSNPPSLLLSFSPMPPPPRLPTLVFQPPSFPPGNYYTVPYRGYGVWDDVPVLGAYPISFLSTESASPLTFRESSLNVDHYTPSRMIINKPFRNIIAKPIGLINMQFPN